MRLLTTRRAGESAAADGSLSVGDLVIEEATYTARLKGRALELTYKEFELLKYLRSTRPGVHPRAAAAGGVGLRLLLRRHPHVDVHVRRCGRSSAPSTTR
ncbi:hypothetical protein GCM10020366_71390 [Saccharopolyspora gregorii]|uniref:Response regulator transcription factor n=1 Tax=Saccharopolyspora gregorii TaxID=33914 RepID=A0ABP6S321_9PSEU